MKNLNLKFLQNLKPVQYAFLGATIAAWSLGQLFMLGAVRGFYNNFTGFDQRGYSIFATGILCAVLCAFAVRALMGRAALAPRR